MAECFSSQKWCVLKQLISRIIDCKNHCIFCLQINKIKKNQKFNGETHQVDLKLVVTLCHQLSPWKSKKWVVTSVGLAADLYSPFRDSRGLLWPPPPPSVLARCPPAGLKIYTIEEGFILNRREGKGCRCFLLQFLATLLTILYQDELMKNTLNCPIFFNSSWCKSAYSSNRPGAKELARQGIEAILSPKKQRRPLPSLLYKSFFYE